MQPRYERAGTTSRVAGVGAVRIGAVLGALIGMMLALFGLYVAGPTLSYHPGDHGVGPAVLALGMGAMAGAAVASWLTWRSRR